MSDYFYSLEMILLKYVHEFNNPYCHTAQIMAIPHLDHFSDEENQ